VSWSRLADSETRNAERLPAFSSLDLFVERFGRIGSSQVTPYFGIQNALGQLNFTEFVPGSASPAPPIGTYHGDMLLSTRGRRLEFGVRVVF
jgi:hypothetical protein